MPDSATASGIESLLVAFLEPPAETLVVRLDRSRLACLLQLWTPLVLPGDSCFNENDNYIREWGRAES